ncbi:transposase family protein [Gemmata palustris]|uniref:transposase family protein n=1 Tax=Gemmata palustris TaxID=2822762 RepID=UPI0028F42D84|nr:transposase family protein [Gemmata palustris]
MDQEPGAILDVSDSVPGPWADIERLQKSRLMKRLPTGVGGINDRGYVGIGESHPTGSGRRRKPRGKEGPPADRKCNRAFRRRRIVVEYAIGRLRRFRAVTRYRRQGHAMRVRAVAGLVNRTLGQRATA